MSSFGGIVSAQPFYRRRVDVCFLQPRPAVAGLVLRVMAFRMAMVRGAVMNMHVEFRLRNEQLYGRIVGSSVQ